MGPLPFLLSLFTLCFYLYLAGPTFYWLDSSEFVAAAWSLGVAHPPGHPLISLLGHLLCLLPVGTLSFRVALASSLAAAGATGLVALISYEILNRMKPHLETPAWVNAIASSLAALCVGFSYSLAFQAVRAEVYALNVLLLVAAAFFLLKWDSTRDRRYLLASAFTIGLALCNHHFLVFLALPALLVFWWLGEQKKYQDTPQVIRPASLAESHRHVKGNPRKVLIGVMGAGALGLCTLVYLPLRAHQMPEVNWGAPFTAQRFSWVVSAQAFHKALDKAAVESVSHRGLGAVFALLSGLGPVASFMALAGLYLLWRKRQTWRIGLFLTLLISGNLLSPMFVGFDPQNPDAHGYLAVSVAFLSPGLAIFIAAVAQVVSRIGRTRVAPSRVAPVLVCLLASSLPVLQGFTRLPECDLRHHWAAEETGRQSLAQPPGTLLLTSYFETIFNIWALQVTGDLRPDLDIIHRHFLSQPGYVDTLQVKLPQLYPLAKTWAKLGQLRTADLDQLTRERTVAFEYDLDLAPEITARLWPAGLMSTYRADTNLLTANSADISLHCQRIEQWTQAVGAIDENETRRSMAWMHFLLTHFACRRHLLDMAHFHYSRLQLLAPEDNRLRRLAQECGL